MRSDRLLKLKNKERDVHKFHFIFSFSEIERERERERLRESQREKPWRRAGLPEGATSNAAPKQRQSDLRSPMTHLPSTIWENFISFFHFSEIKREWEKERNTLREGRKEHQAPEQRQSDLRSSISDLRSTMRGKRRWRRGASCGVAVTWPWVTGFGLPGFGFGLCIGDFFFFFR